MSDNPIPRIGNLVFKFHYFNVSSLYKIFWFNDLCFLCLLCEFCVTNKFKFYTKSTKKAQNSQIIKIEFKLKYLFNTKL